MIYDGIQRPLELIREERGDYIQRGVELPALDRQRLWHFKPQVKVGQELVSGDILGEVKETGLIKHKILLPWQISGKVVQIQEGDFKIDDVVAKIENSGKVFEIKMVQRWPVRKPRSVKERLTPNEPLITGQRVIDTLFPVAKGGTACIPGPFGSGKCVSGDTPVVLGNGRIVSMQEIFEEAKAKGKLLNKDSYEEIYDIRGLENPSTISFNQSTFSITEPVAVYKGKTDSTVIIKTRTGKTVEITPVHKLLILEDGRLRLKEAKDINIGDYIASPRRIKLNLENQNLNILDLLYNKKIFSCDENINQKARCFLKKLIEGKIVPQKYCQYLKKSRKKSRRIPLGILRDVSLKSSLSLTPSKICSYHGKEIRLPKEINPELSEFLAYIIADGNLKRSSFSIKFYNSSQELLNRFIELSKALFDISPYIYKHPKSNSYIAQIDCKALFDLLVSLGLPYRQKAKNATVPECILRSSDEVIASFIAAYIACDGNLDKKGKRIEIYSASKKILIQINFLLLRLGIISKLYKERKDGTFRMTINSIGDLEKNLKRINIIGKKKITERDFKDKKSYFLDAIKIPSCLRVLLLEKGNLSYLQKKGIYAASYCYSKKQRIGVDTIFKIVEKLSKINQVSEEVKTLINLLENIFFDEITEKRVVLREKDVYDIQIPFLHNFVGGNGALILHNTVVLHEFAKWSDADIVVYVACGERANEVADLLLTLPKLKDPRTGKPLMEKTVVIANASNMPVAAREASIYTGITIGEYFRDMGYSVALMADSTSRWAEALREISGRLEEMPGEEGYPAYLATRLAEFYERAGKVVCLGSNQRSGTLTVMGAVSPPGGDLSDPVVQNTLRVVKVFWGLDDKLASSRHFPAVNWLNSYSLYHENIKKFLTENISEQYIRLRTEAMKLLEQESELMEIARLVGVETLSLSDRLILEIARMIREDFLHQNAFHEVDTYTSVVKQYRMLKLIIDFYRKAEQVLKENKTLKDILQLPARQKIARAKYIPEEKLEEFDEIEKMIRG
jgi:V/A-type H+-transporting ATPase subunit A